MWTVGIETMKTVSAEDMNCMWQMIGFAKMRCLTEWEVNRMIEKQENRMTGSEAWSIVAPILARFVNEDDEFIEAYAIVYGALKKFDKAGEQE